MRPMTNDRVQKYGIILLLEYKNNGLLNNPNFQIEPSVAIHKLSESSILFNAIDITFLALIPSSHRLETTSLKVMW